jgi:hypothetical protein
VLVRSGLISEATTMDGCGGRLDGRDGLRCALLSTRWAMYTVEGLFTAAVGSGKVVEAAGSVSRGVYGTA